MEASIRTCFFFLAMSALCACALAMPTVESRDDLGQPRREPSRSWSGVLRGPNRASVPSRFDTQLVDLNRNPTYYNYHILPEDALTDVVRVQRPRQRRNSQRYDGHGGGRSLYAGFPSDDILRPPSFRDEQPRQPQRTPFSDFSRTGCIDGGPSCTPKPQRKYFDFYS
ncbi:uncharacterized protein LOC124153758 [Ischnura elegans]|uniref:uncharacterized protein LOC124153758 n=1 Tax=Ischnura elegans TaxID=197161 RepID=UPI001ED8A8CF|nr:uncharacterized protein LOC124153758 [Ischnura elegans]